MTGFIDTYLDLNFKEQVEFEEELSKVEGAKKEAVMELTTSWKREGIKEGIKEGKLEGKLDLLLMLLTHRFGPLRGVEERQIRDLPEQQVEKLAEAILDFQSREEFTAWLVKAQS